MAERAAVSLTINGEQHTLDDRHAHDAARPAARAPRPDRREEGLRPRPVRRLHGAARRPPRQRLPRARGRPRRRRRAPRSRGSADGGDAAPAAGGVHRARRLPVRLLHARADLLRGRHARPRPTPAGRATRPPTSPATRSSTRRRDPRADERQPVPLRRVREHRRRDRGGRRGEAVRLRAGRRRRAAPWRVLAGTPGARFLGGGTNLVDLMKLGVETPDVLVDVTPPARRPGRATARRRAADRRRRAATATSPPTRASASATRVLAAGAARRRLGPAAQHGDRSAATCCSARAAPTSRTSTKPVQQARAGLRLPGASRATTATTRSSGTREHCVATHPSDMAVALAALDAVVHVLGPDGERDDPDRRACTGCPATTPERDTVLAPAS